MNTRLTSTAPVAFLFLVLPNGISSGFVSVTLPYLLTHHGFSVAAAASITAVALSSNLWRFVWAPLTDITLSLHKWYWIGLTLCATTLGLLCGVPLEVRARGLLTFIVLVSQIAATFVLLPVGGFMAKTVVEEKKGRAGGWYQAGNLGGMGLGGGAGIWLSTHVSYATTILILSASMMLCGAVLYFVQPVPAEKVRTLAQQLRGMARDVRELFRSPLAVFTILLLLAPIGTGAAAGIWSSVADDWHVSAGTVALVTGTLSGVISMLGCVFGGWVADRVGRWWCFFGAGTLMALVTLVLSFARLVPPAYVGGVLLYAFSFGMANAGFSAVILQAIGKGLASTKYALFSSIGNIAPVYITVLDGWLHDSFSVRAMLLGEALAGLGAVLIFLYALSRMQFMRRAAA